MNMCACVYIHPEDKLGIIPLNKIKKEVASDMILEMNRTVKNKKRH